MTEITLRHLNTPQRSQADWISHIANSKYLSRSIDYYSEGELVTRLEERIADILGKPSALFFAKGMVAQFCAFKVVQEESNNRLIAVHPLSHLAFDEKDSYSHLLGLEGCLIGDRKPFGVHELSRLNETPAIVSVELPLRRAGFLLPKWSELQQMSEWCRDKNVHLHMDGARLWESTHYYQQSESEIANLFNSVYVSLYKGLGAMGGAVLAGSESFIERCKVWRTRFGGDAYTNFPLLVTALEGLDHRLTKIPESFNRAKQIATMLSDFPELEVAQPHTNGFFVYLKAELNPESIERLNRIAAELNNQMQLKLFNAITTFPESSRCLMELQVGGEHEKISDTEIEQYFSCLLRHIDG